MNRTVIVAPVALLLLSLAALAQTPPTPPAKAAQADPIGEVVARIQDAEQRLHSARIELRTEGHLPSGLTVETKGQLSVLRGEQASIRTAFEFAMGEGIRGRLESAQTAAGIVLYEDDPAFGEVYLRIDPAVVADLEWAGDVLHRGDLPGMGDGRGRSPLGSQMLADLQRAFTFAIGEAKEREGEPGTWLLGTRRKNLGDQDPDLPLADKVEAFVRDRDQAVLEVKYLTGDQVSQRIVVTKLEVDVPMAATEFHVDGRGQSLLNVDHHKPTWELIEDALRQAEAKSEAMAAKESDPAKKPPVLRPSQRPH